MAGAAVGILVSALTLFNQANLAEPYWLAHRQYVKDQLHESLQPLEQRLIVQERGQVQAARDNARDKLFDLGVLQKREGMPPEVNINIERQKQDLLDRIDALNSRIQQLNREQR